MRAIDLDFAPARPAGIRSWTIFTLGLLSLLLCGFAQQLVSSQQVESAEVLARSEAGTASADRQAEVMLSPEELRRARALLAEVRSISEQVNRPWERLFLTLESLPLTDVALLSLVTDGHTRQLRVQAEARDLTAMLRFHQQLEASEELSDTYLINHEVVVQAEGEPVRFNLLVTWSGSNAPL